MPKKITEYEYPKCIYPECGKPIERPVNKHGVHISPSQHKKTKYCLAPATCRQDDYQRKLGVPKKEVKSNKRQWKDTSTVHYYIGSC